MIGKTQSAPAKLSNLFWMPPALLLIAASLSKSFSPLPFVNELSNYAFGISSEVKALVALVLPALEMLLGAMILWRGSVRVAIGTIVLLLIFSVGILAALPSGYLHSCGCLGPEKLDPTLALLKNCLAILLLLVGFFPMRRKLTGENPWGAFALVAGGAWAGPMTLSIYALSAALALFSSRLHMLFYCFGLVLGLSLHLAGFPLLAIIAAATVFYCFRVRGSYKLRMAPIWIGVMILLLTFLCFLFPPAPAQIPALLQVGKPLPAELKISQPLLQNELHQTLIIFLQPDCDECRDWLPQAAAIWRRPSLPPLIGLAPGLAAALEAYRQRESISFALIPISPQAFSRAISRTPQLIFLEDDTLRHIFLPGSLLRLSDLEDIIEHEKK